MTLCDYRHDCWHEDTCHCQDQALVKPGCWMPKGDGWKPEPDAPRVDRPVFTEPNQKELF